jgi:hypothetical protein
MVRRSIALVVRGRVPGAPVADLEVSLPAVLQQVRAFWLALNELPAGDPSEAHAVTAQLVAAS